MIPIPIGIHSRIYTFLEGFLVSKEHACNTFTNSQQNYINIHHITPVLGQRWLLGEDKKVDASET